MLVILVNLVVRKSGMDTHVRKPKGEGNRVAENHDGQFRWKLVIPFFRPPAHWEEESWKVKVVERKPFTSTEVKKELKLFFAQLFLSISSVSTVQSQTCATTWNQITLEVKSVSLWWYRLRIATTNTTSQTSQSAQGNLLQDYFKKLAEIPEGQKLAKLCKVAGFLKRIEKWHFFITIEEGSEIMQTACR